MRIKIIGESDCARATRHLLRKAGFAVTEFLPAEVVTHGPQAGYVITIELAPATPDPHAFEPGFPQQVPLADHSREASGAQCGTDASLAGSASAEKSGQAEVQATESSASERVIRFDSVDSELEAAILRHVTQLTSLPVMVDRQGGVVRSEREVRIIVPSSRSAEKEQEKSRQTKVCATEADQAAAVAVEFGVLRGLLDLMQPLAQTAATPATSPAPRKWWRLFVVMLALAFASGGTLRAAPRLVPIAAESGLRGRAADGSFLALTLAPGALFPQLAGPTGQIFSSVYDSGDSALKVNCEVGCGATSGFSDNGTFTAGSTAVNTISAVFNDSIAALASGNAGALRATSDRMLYVNIGKLGGTVLSGADVVDSGNTAFRVNCVVGCSASAGFADDSGFTAGTTAETNVGGVYNDGLAAVASGSAAAARITAYRALQVNLRDASGNEIGISSAPVRVDPTGTTTQPVSGSVTANAGSGTFNVSGTVTANAGTGAFTVAQSAASNLNATVAQSSGANLHVDVDSAPTTTVSGAVTANAGSGTFTVGGTVTANAGTGNFATNTAQVGGSMVSTAASGTQLVGIADGSGNKYVADPCQANAKSYASINQTANTQLVAGTSGKKIYPCSIHVVTATAQNIALVEGTGTTCGTGTAGVQGFGGASAASGWNFAANGGIAYGDGGHSIGAESSAGDNLCVYQSGSGQVSGGLSYVVQ